MILPQECRCVPILSCRHLALYTVRVITNREEAAGNSDVRQRSVAAIWNWTPTTTSLLTTGKKRDLYVRPNQLKYIVSGFITNPHERDRPKYFGTNILIHVLKNTKVFFLGGGLEIEIMCGLPLLCTISIWMTIKPL